MSSEAASYAIYTSSGKHEIFVKEIRDEFSRPDETIVTVDIHPFTEPRQYATIAEYQKGLHFQIDDDIDIHIIRPDAAFNAGPYINSIADTADELKNVFSVETFTAQMTRETSVERTSAEIETVTQRSSITLRNLAEAYSLFPQFELMMLLCPETNIDLIQNWKTSDLTKKLKIYDPQLFQLIDSQCDENQASLVTTQVMPISTVSWTREILKPHALPGNTYQRAEYIASTCANDVCPTTAAQDQIISQLLDEHMKQTSKLFSDPSNAYRKQMSALVQTFSRYGKENVFAPGTVTRDYERLTTREQFNLLRFLHSQEPKPKLQTDHIKFSQNSLSMILPCVARFTTIKDHTIYTAKTKNIRRTRRM